MKKLLSALAAAGAIIFGAAAFSQTRGDAPAPPAQRLTVSVDGREREYFVVTGPRSARARAVVIVLHGGTRSANDIFTRSSWPEVAARNGALLIVPNAIGGNWNDGRTQYLGNANPSNVDDVGFLRRLVEIAVRDLGGDRSRVYFAGASNGGNMSWRMACEAGDIVTAIAPIIATMPLNPQSSCARARPTAVIAFFGTEDPLMRYDGSPFTLGRRTMEARSSAPDSTAFWAKVNGCTGRTREERLPDVDRRDQTTAMRITYLGCPAAQDVIRYDIIGGGHNQPGSEVPGRFGRLLGRGNQDIDAVDLSWAFFQRHAR